MQRLIRFSLAFLLLVVVCSVEWETTHTQSNIRRITQTSEEETNINPSLSGDGKVIAFESTADVGNAAGGEAFRAIRASISSEPIAFMQFAASRAPAPALSQDGSRIAFASKDDPLGTNPDGNSEIFFYDGSRLTQLTNTSPIDLALRSVNGSFLPSISDDGRFVAFSSNRNLTNQNADGNLEMFVCDTSSSSFTQLTNSIGIIGATDAKISGDGSRIAYIREITASPNNNRELVLQTRVGPPDVKVLASGDASLAMTYGRAISDDGQRVVWSAEIENNRTQVFLWDGRNNEIRQITTLGTRATEVPLHPTISGNGLRIAFATRRTVAGMGSNSDASVELYTYDIPSGTFGRVTNVDSAKATAEVLSSLNDDGTVIAFNYSRLLSSAVSNEDFASNSEIYLTTTPAPPASGTLQILNRAAMGHEPATVNVVAPDSIAIAFGSSLSFRTEQSQPLTEGVFPLSAGGTTITVNGRRAQVFFASPTEVHFHVPAATEPGLAEVVVTNSDGFQSRGAITIANAGPGIFTRSGDGLGVGMVLDAEALTTGPFDPTSGNLRLIIFATGIRNGSAVSVSAGTRTLPIELIERSPTLPGLDELHVRVPVELRGAGLVDLLLRADGRDSNSASIEFSGDARRNMLINEFLADPPDGIEGDANHDGVRETSQDEFVELVNTSPHDIDLGGYQLLTRSSATSNETVRHVFAPHTIVSPCNAIVVFGGGGLDPSNPAFGGAQVVKASSGSLGLSNSTGVVTLLEADHSVHGFVVYGGSSQINAGDNQSITRAPDLQGPFTKHLVASAAASRFSPGTQLNGSTFQACSPPLSRVEISPNNATLEVGQQQPFVARALDQNGNVVPGVIFNWQTTNSDVFTIDQNGLGTAIAPGSALLTVTARGLTSTPATILVKLPPPILTSIAITPAEATLAVGETQQFIAQAKDQYGNNFGVDGIHFASGNETIATLESVALNVTEGSATANLTTRATGLVEIRASATRGLTTVISAPAILRIEPAAGQLLISEFRTRGPAGAADEFIEIYNPTTVTLHIGGLKIRASNVTGNTSDRVTIPSDKLLGPGCHYLVANNSSAGYSGPASPDQTYLSGISDDGGLAITGASGTRVIDAVGMSTGSIYREGVRLAPLTNNGDHSYERRPGSSFGNGVDSDNNATDFLLNASGGNPQNQSSTCLDLNAADLSITQSSTPNPVVIGADITSVLTVTNHGAGLAKSVVVTDSLPASLTFLSCVPTGHGVCGGTGNTRTASFSSLESGESVTVTLVARANGPAGAFINNASVTSATADPRLENNVAGVTTVVQSPPPQLSITDATVTEGDAGTANLEFKVKLSGPAPLDVFFDLNTSDETASLQGMDYVPKNLLRQKIPIGESEYTFTVEVFGDTLVEFDETLLVKVTNVSGAVVVDDLARGTIRNDDIASLVISQVYGGGGNVGAQFSHDFVEIFNRGKTTIDFSVTPYSIQYAGATASFGSNKVNLTNGIVLPGGYFLVQLGGGTNATPLPRPDAIGSIVMAATAGKVALVHGTSNLAGSGCALTDSVADFLGYGSTANCYRGNSPAPAPASATSAFRRNGGCLDTGVNAADFFVHAPIPRNTTSPSNDCLNGVVPELSISDYVGKETDDGARTFHFVVSLSVPSSSDVMFDISTEDKTATIADNDYETKSLSNQIIPAGQLSFSFVVTVNGDAAVEADEIFLVNLTNVIGATVTRLQAVGTIQNDDLPSLSITDVAAVEGNAGNTTIDFAVRLSSPAAAPVLFNISTDDGSARMSDNDYLAQSLTNQAISVGQQSYSFKVTVIGDIRIEPDETFLVRVSNVSGATLVDGEATATIRNDDAALLSIGDVAIKEGDNGLAFARFTVTSSLPAPADGIRFNIQMQDKSATSGTGDYIARILNNQSIPPGHNAFSFEVEVNGDSLVEPDETFLVKLANASNATIADDEGIATILNDDLSDLLISQFYPGGGNTGATFANDFVEIFNHGSTTVDFAVTPYSIQYAGATTNFSANKVDLVTGAMAPGQYFLLRLAGGANGGPIPTPDASGGIAMAATAGKVALVKGTTALVGNGCPLPAVVADFVGYGGSANCFDGPAPAPAPSATSSLIRKAGGCWGTHDNSIDFFAHAPAPRNSATPLNNCSDNQEADLSIADASVVEGDAGSTTLTFTVRLSETMPSTDVIFDVATQNQTATTGSNDYESRSLKNQIIPAGQLTYDLHVTVNGDTLVEPDETFLVNVTNVVGANVTHSSAVGKIENDDLPKLTITDVSMAEGDSGTNAFTFVIELSAPPPDSVVFDVATQKGTATTADNDFVAAVLQGARINPGERSLSFSVIVNGDLKIEDDEAFSVKVSNVQGADVVDNLGIGTIQNDDAPRLSINDASVAEGDAGTTALNFTVSSSIPAPAAGIRFNIASEDLTALAATGDYIPRSLQNQIIPAGQTSYPFAVTINGDSLVEPDEAFAVKLTSVQGATLADDTGAGTIQNDDVPKLVISQIYGGGGNSGAIFRNDFVEIFNRGTTTVDLKGWSIQYSSATSSSWSTTSLCLASSCLLLPGRYFLVQEDRGSGGTSDLPVPDTSGTIAMTAAAGKVALVSVTTPLTGSCPMSAHLIDLVGYGANASCFEGVGPAPAAGNTLAEIRKGGGCSDVASNNSDFFTHPPSPRNSSLPSNICASQETDLIINDVTAVEGDVGKATVNFTVTLLGSSAANVTVNYSTSTGSASAASDFEPSLGQLTFLPGETSKTISVTINGDTIDEPDEIFFVTLSNPTNAALLDHQGIATITDNDIPPTLTIDDVAFSEGSGSSVFSITVNLSAPALEGGVAFDIATADGTAHDGSLPAEDHDYSARSLCVVVIPAGQQKYKFDVVVNGDLIDEPNETFFVNVTNVSGAVVSDAQALATIVNDDSPVLSVDDVSQAEGDSGTTVFNFTVNSSMPAPSGGITFDVSTADQTAHAGDGDYVPLNSVRFEIPAGQTSVVVPVSINGDKLVEPHETFQINLTNISGASSNDPIAVGTIQNDDVAHLVISQVYPGGGNAGATYTNDFIELFNRGSTTVNFALTPYSLQYAGASGSFGSVTAANKTNLISGVIGPGQYFLVQGASGGSNGIALPAVDMPGSIAMSATGGKVALVVGTAALSSTTCPGDDAAPPTNPSGSNIADFVAYGSGANTPNCFEGSGAAAFSTSTAGGLDPDARSVIRVASCVDNNNNSTDFTNPTTAPVARNKASVPAPCP